MEIYCLNALCRQRKKLREGLMSFDSFSLVFHHAGILPMDNVSSGGMKSRGQSSIAALLKEAFGFPQKDEDPGVSVLGKVMKSEYISFGEFTEAVAK